jgi:hypothetical protein
MQEHWFPASASNAQVMGRFVDVETVDPKASEKAGRSVYKLIPALQSKVVGSHDVSVQVVKPFNASELKSRFPGAWEAYEAMKNAAAQASAVAAAPEPEVIARTVKGTPLSKADFLPRGSMEWLERQGVQTIEQIAGLSDQAVQNMGREVGKWRKQAKAWLERT